MWRPECGELYEGGAAGALGSADCKVFCVIKCACIVDVMAVWILATDTLYTKESPDTDPFGAHVP
jgi:hypothetical protein